MVCLFVAVFASSSRGADRVGGNSLSPEVGMFSLWDSGCLGDGEGVTGSAIKLGLIFQRSPFRSYLARARLSRVARATDVVLTMNGPLPPWSEEFVGRQRNRQVRGQIIDTAILNPPVVGP